MASDLVQLVAELREKRKDLAERLPWTCGCEESVCESWTNRRGDEEFGESTARAIVHGVCAEVLAESEWSNWSVKRAASGGWYYSLWADGCDRSGPYPDFTTALVRATIAAKEADRE